MPAFGAGQVPFALTQQIDVNGRPLAGCLLYIYQVGTTATLQNAFSDFGLTQTLPNPIQCDQTGRLPNFYLADGQVHVRLTDSGGLVQVDIPVLQVVGPSTGGGGGGSVDPNTIASVGDVKFRPTSEILPGWVKLNGLTIGSPTSGATQRANADTQALFIYLWNNCTDAHCPVIGGRGASGLSDFNANKQITLPDWRGRHPMGLDDMGRAAAGRIIASNVTSGGGDDMTTPMASGGEANHTLITNEIPAHGHTYSGTTSIQSNGHTHTGSGTTSFESASHTHSGSVSGTTSGASNDHTHSVTVSGTTGAESIGHTHSGTTDSAGDHSHTYTAPSGTFAATAGANAGSSTISSSTSTAGAHTHTFTTGGESAAHVHAWGGTFNTLGASIDHTHTFSAGFTTGLESANHTHTYSFTTSDISANHTHTYSGTTANTGGNLSHNVMDPFILGTWYMKL